MLAASINGALFLCKAPHTSIPSPVYPHPVQEPSFHFPASPHIPVAVSTPAPTPPTVRQPEYLADSPTRNGHGVPAASSDGPISYHNTMPQAPQHASELDAHYWKNMFLELGFGEHGEGQPMPSQALNDARSMPQYTDVSHHQSQVHQQQEDHISYHHVHQSSLPNTYAR